MSIHPLTRWQRIAAFLTNTDPDVLAECGHQELNQMYSLLLTQALSSTLIFLVALYAIDSWFPSHWAVAGAALVSGLLFLLDRSFIGADWELKGILARPGLSRWLRRLSRLGPRLALSAVLMYGVLAVPFELALQEGQLNEIREQQYKDKNGAYLSELREARNTLEAQLAGYSARTHEAAETIDRLKQQGEQLREAKRALDDKFNHYRAEAYLEANGIDGRAKGKGQKYQHAVMQMEQAATRLDSLDQEQQGRLQELQQAREELQQLRDAEQQFEAGIPARLQQLSDRFKQEGMYVEDREGPMIAWQMRRILHQHPEYGQAAQWFSYAIAGGLMLLELMPLLKTMFFSAGSVYQVKRVVKLQAASASEIHAYRRELIRLRGMQSEDPALLPRTTEV